MEQLYSVLTVCKGVFLLSNDCTCSERKRKGKKRKEVASHGAEGDKEHVSYIWDYG